MAELTATASRGFSTSELHGLRARRRSPAADLAGEMTDGSGARARLREIPFLTQTAVRAAPGSGADRPPGSPMPEPVRTVPGSGIDEAPRATVRMNPGSAVEAALGFPLPARVGEVTGSGEWSALWLSPDEFLVVGPDLGLGTAAFADRLAAGLAGQRGQVVDVSANRTTLELSGPYARQVLDKSCRLDLHPRAFPVGRAVATLLDAVGVILWRTGEDTWRVMPRASFTTHVVRRLLDGMREHR